MRRWVVEVDREGGGGWEKKEESEGVCGSSKQEVGQGGSIRQEVWQGVAQWAGSVGVCGSTRQAVWQCGRKIGRAWWWGRV
mgnify:CR=1 FL=1